MRLFPRLWSWPTSRIHPTASCSFWSCFRQILPRLWSNPAALSTDAPLATSLISNLTATWEAWALAFGSLIWPSSSLYQSVRSQTWLPVTLVFTFLHQLIFLPPSTVPFISFTYSLEPSMEIHYFQSGSQPHPSKLMMPFIFISGKRFRFSSRMLSFREWILTSGGFFLRQSTANLFFFTLLIKVSSVKVSPPLTHPWWAARALPPLLTLEFRTRLRFEVWKVDQRDSWFCFQKQLNPLPTRLVRESSFFSPTTLCQ